MGMLINRIASKAFDYVSFIWKYSFPINHNSKKRVINDIVSAFLPNIYIIFKETDVTYAGSRPDYPTVPKEVTMDKHATAKDSSKKHISGDRNFKLCNYDWRPFSVKLFNLSGDILILRAK